MLAKLFRKDIGFFDLFNQHAEIVVKAADEFILLLEDCPDYSRRLDQIDGYERSCDQITHMTVDLLHKTFITPLDRDEIVRLISRLDDIIDAIYVAAKRMKLFNVTFIPSRLKEQAEVLARSTKKVQTITAMVSDLKKINDARELAERMHRLENEGDVILASGLSDLFKDYANDPLTVIKLKEIYEVVEMAIDRCEDVANLVEGLFLEHA